MPITYLDDRAIFRDRVAAEEAEPLLQWLQDHAQSLMDLGPCAHLHTAVLQTLLSARCSIAVFPENPELRAWLLNSTELRRGDQEVTAVADAP